MNPETADAIPTDAAAEQAMVAAQPETEATDHSDGNQSAESIAVNPREAMMNHIVAQREQELEISAQEPSTDADPGQPLEAIDQNPEPETLSIKVDGIEQQIPIDQARATIQKNFAADKRLNDAVLKQQQLQQWEQQLHQREQQLQVSDVISSHADDDDQTSEKLKAAVDALYDGDTDDAVKALSEVIGRSENNPATLTPEQISQQATEQVMRNLEQQRMNAEIAEGKALFNSEFSDLAGNPELHDMANRKTIELMTVHQDWSPIQIIKEAGRQTREWVQNLSGQQSPGRNERKQQLQNMPRSTGSVAYQPPEPDNGPTKPMDVIQQMRQDRGQA